MKSFFSYRMFVVLVLLAVGAGVTGGLLLSGSPAKERLKSLDRRRLEHLNQLANSIDIYWNNKQALPATLDSLTQEHIFLPNEVRLDPVTRTPYPYRIITTSTYELCAVFDTDTRQDYTKEYPEPPPSTGGLIGTHPAERFCWTRSAQSWIRP